MTRFLKRFIGVMALDPAAFEEIEGDRLAGLQSVAVVVLVCLAGGFATRGLGLIGIPGFVAGAIVSLGAFLVWSVVVMTLGTITMAEPQTRSSMPEVLRVLGFSAAPGVLIAFAAMPAVAPVVCAIVAGWMIAAAVMGVQRALDYRSWTRAIAVCVVAWLLSTGVVLAALMMFNTNVS
jgi:hypothetical protein